MGDEKRVECFLFHQFFENVLRHFEIGQLRENFHAKIFRPLPPFFARDFKPIRARHLPHQIVITRPAPRPR